MLANKDKQHIKDSWGYVVAHSNELAQLFYPTLFQKYPNFKKLFSGDSATQSRKLAYSITVIITKLNKLEQIKNEVSALAKRHLRYGVLPSDFKPFGEIFIQTLGKVMKDKWNEDIEQAWIKVYTIISDAMTEIMKENAS